MGFVDHAPQGRRPAQHGIDFFVVVRVIAVVGRRLKDRREVDGIDTQVGEVIEVFDHADQVAPLIAVIGRLRTPLVQVLRLGQAQRPREAVGKDLVENRVANPVGSLGIGQCPLSVALVVAG